MIYAKTTLPRSKHHVWFWANMMMTKSSFAWTHFEHHCISKTVGRRCESYIQFIYIYYYISGNIA